MKELLLSRLGRDLQTAEWADDERLVVYDEGTGETLLLNPVDWAALTAFRADETEVSFETWGRRVAADLDVSADEEFLQYLAALVRQLEDVGLVRCSPA